MQVSTMLRGYDRPHLQHCEENYVANKPALYQHKFVGDCDRSFLYLIEIRSYLFLRGVFDPHRAVTVG